MSNNSCPVTTSEPNVLSQTNSTSDVKGGSDGSIDVVALGGIAPYDISWIIIANGPSKLMQLLMMVEIIQSVL